MSSRSFPPPLDQMCRTQESETESLGDVIYLWLAKELYPEIPLCTISEKLRLIVLLVASELIEFMQKT